MRRRVFPAFGLLLAACGLHAQTPAVLDGGVSNAASFTRGGPVAPGALISIFGNSLASSLASADSVPLSTTLGDVTSVTINGTAAPLLLVSEHQINAQAPWEVTPGQANVVVNRSSGSSDPRALQVNTFAPAIFFLASPGGRLLALAQNSDDSLLSQPDGSIPGLKCRPAKPGGSLIIYAEGLGPVDTPIATGSSAGATVSNTTNQPVVLIGGVQAQVTFSGLSPNFVGVNQINIVVPQGAPTGNAVSLQIQIGGVSSTDPVTIAIQNGP